MSNFLQQAHIINGLYPVADAFASATSTDRINIKDYGKLGFIIHTGDATGGTADGVVTVNAFAAATGGSGTALPFDYRVCLSSTSVDTWSTTTRAATTGFAMTAGDNRLYYIELDAELVSSTVSGKPFITLTVTEDTNDPIVAGIIILGLDPRYPQDVPISAIA